MIPVLAAAFAKPAIRYGVMGGAAFLLVGSIWGHGYATGKKVVHEEWNAEIAAASASAVHESVKAEAMESVVVKATDQAERVIEAKAEPIKKEVVHHAKKDKKPLSAATVAIYDRLISLPNEAGRSVPPADLSAGAPEVPRGGLAVETADRVSNARIQVQPGDGEPVELTTEELAQAAVDFAEKYALMKNAYKGLSDWNEGRERLELQRLQQD